MASFIRCGVCRLANKTGQVLFAKVEPTFTRSISSKTIRDRDTDRPVKPQPYDYNNKSYNIFKYWIDRTTSRLDENSKIVVVEGPVAAGKTKFAKTLAEELDMFYFPEANLDMIYINQYGFDYRQLDEQMPESCRTFDIKNFLLNPKHQNVAAFQIKQYYVKFSQYIDALAHLLSTGQGIVLDRSCYSDFVFVEAMYKQGFLSKGAYKAYYEIRDNTLHELMKPHLVIYLDVPVPRVQQNIKKRNLSCEKNSQVLTSKYLETMETSYKQKYLKEAEKHSELLIYDWSEGGDAEIVVEDIERIDFDNYDFQDPKMKDWRGHNEEDWGAIRNEYCDKKDEILANFCVPLHRVPELVISGEEAKIYWDTINSAPGNVYAPGFNAAMGDTGIFFKTSGPRRDTLPMRERNLE